MERKTDFCTKCGSALPEGSRFCGNCGASVMETEGERPVKKAGKHWKWILNSGLGVILLVAVSLVVANVFGGQDINTIQGCPEFYDVKFGMSMDEVDARIEVEHTHGMDGNLVLAGIIGESDPSISVESGTAYRLYGRPVERVKCRFEGEKLSEVTISLSEEDVSYEEMAEQYQKQYGSPNKGGITESESVWRGAQTEIEISAPAGGTADTVQITYSRAS